MKKTAMTKLWILTLIITSALQACQGKSNSTPPLTLKVFTASPNGFQVNSTLVMGNKDAVLIDAQFSIADADSLVKVIQGTKKNLTTVYITHSHPDHYYGLVQMRKAFPNAKFVALPTTAAEIQSSYKDRLAFWKGFLGANADAITSDPILPEALTGTTLTVEGQTLQITGGVQGDITLNSFIWIPSIKAVICGDTDYNGVFPYTIETTPAQRTAWSNTISEIQALKPEIVIAGHKNPSLPNDASSLDSTKAYLAYYDQVLPTSTSSTDFQNKMKAKFPTLNLPIILQLAADAAFK